ncbi:MAG: hypothetical protein AAF999_14105 [Pseudomonadota bacterium]
MLSGAAFALVLPLAACLNIRERLAEQPVTRVTAQPVDQACDAPEQTERRLSGAYLRQSDASGLTFVPVLVTGRENRNGLTEDVTIVDESQSEKVDDKRGTIAVGKREAIAKARSGFGPADTLPNVYDVTYTTRAATFRGPMVLGPGAFLDEIPNSGARLFSGQIAITLISQDDDGAQSESRSTGQFSLQAGYGSARASLTASGFDESLPFDSLQWTNLFLCGTRFVSSGQGVVTVSEDGSPALPPFKTDRETPAFTALFESSLFAPEERPGPPVSIGGIFVIQSDNGTLIGALLSDQPVPPVVIEEEDTDA